MSDIFSLRVARAAEKNTSASESDISVEGPEVFSLLVQLELSATPREVARAYLDALGYPSDALRTDTFKSLDVFLDRSLNRPTLAALLKELNIDSGPNIAEELQQWLDENRTKQDQIAAACIATLLTPAKPSLRNSFIRALSIYGLIEAIAASPEKYQGTTATTTSAAGSTEDPSPQLIFDALRWRIVVFPERLNAIADRLEPPGAAVTRQGLADLFVVRNDWLKYQAGEIAHIENVLAGEKKLRKHSITDVREVSQTIDTTTTSSAERDDQSTNRFEMNDESSRDIQLAVHAEAQVDTSGQYGPTKVDSHLGGSLDYSQKDSTRRTVTLARETVSRAITKVEQTVRTIRMERTISTVKEINTHELTNTTNVPFSGIYRWVDKIMRFTVFRYPNRYLLEFVVPEPGSWIRWLYAKRSAPTGIKAEKPDPFTIVVTTTTTTPSVNTTIERKIEPGDISEKPADSSYYLKLGSRYYTESLQPPPSNILVTELFVRETKNPWEDTPNGDPINFVKLGDITVPAGYEAKRWWITIHGWGNPRASTPMVDQICNIRVIVGNPELDTPSWSAPVSDAFDQAQAGPFNIVSQQIALGIGGATSETKLPVAAALQWIRGLSANITVECIPTSGEMDRWRIATYEKIASAYFAMKDRYDSEISSSEIREGVVIKGNSPERNQQVAREELKKQIIGMLFDRSIADNSLPFQWSRLIDEDIATKECPERNLI